MVNGIDKCITGFKRRLESLQTAPHLIPAMLERALNAGCEATYVLMDSWFTYAPLMEEIRKLGLDIIGMVKNDNMRYILDDKKDLKKLYSLASPVVSSRKRTILRSIRTHLVPNIPVLVVFVRHRSKRTNGWRF